MSGPLALRTRNTMLESADSARQSQLWAWIRRPLVVTDGSATTPVQPSSIFSCTCAASLKPNIISVRQLTVTTPSSGTRAPSAMPRISSM